MKTKSFFFSIILILLITVSCSGNIPGTDATATPALPQAASTRVSSGMGSFFSIDEVGLGSNGYVTLTNFTDQPANLGGLFLCQGSQCFGLPDVVVDAGKTVRIAAGDGAGYEGVVATRATLGELRPADGEIALLASQELDDPQAMLAYFQWGSTPHKLTQIAIEAGLWLQGGYGPSSQTATRLFRNKDSGLWLFDEP